jgi:hypothetical protein
VTDSTVDRSCQRLLTRSAMQLCMINSNSNSIASAYLFSNGSPRIHIITWPPTACINSWRYSFQKTSVLRCSARQYLRTNWLFLLYVNDLPDAVTNSTVLQMTPKSSVELTPSPMLCYSRTATSITLNPGPCQAVSCLTKENAKVLVNYYQT